LYFAGDPILADDPLVKDSLIVDKNGRSAQFDIVLRTT